MLKICYIFLILLCSWHIFAMPLTLSSLFSDHMVLQRNALVRIWGTADPALDIVAEFRGETKKTKVGLDGKWEIIFSPGEAGGQSNMVWPVVNSSNGAEQIGAADEKSAIRIFEISRTLRRSFVPLTELAQSKGWECTSPSSVRNFSAIGYGFAQRLQHKLQIPIGIISCCRGGTPIETWISMETSSRIDSLSARVSSSKQYLSTSSEAVARIQQEFSASQKELNQKFTTAEFVSAYSRKEYIPDDNWRKIQMPSWLGSVFGDEKGLFVFRKTIEIPNAMAEKDLLLELGTIRNVDAAYFNGSLVGSCGSVKPYHFPDQDKPRRYTVPRRLIKPGTNVIVILVVNQGNGGGFPPCGTARQIRQGDQTVPLSGEWQAQLLHKLPAHPAQEEYNMLE